MHFDYQYSSRQPAPIADPLPHSRRHILASVLLLLDSDCALADWSLPQLPHVSGFTYKGNRFLVATDKEAEQIVWGWIENNLWAVTNTDEDIELLLQHLQISPSLVEAFNGQAAIHYLQTVHPKKFCKLLSPAIAIPPSLCKLCLRTAVDRDSLNAPFVNQPSSRLWLGQKWNGLDISFTALLINQRYFLAHSN